MASWPASAEQRAQPANALLSPRWPGGQRLLVPVHSKHWLIYELTASDTCHDRRYIYYTTRSHTAFMGQPSRTQLHHFDRTSPFCSFWPGLTLDCGSFRSMQGVYITPVPLRHCAEIETRPPPCRPRSRNHCASLNWRASCFHNF